MTSGLSLLIAPRQAVAAPLGHRPALAGQQGFVHAAFALDDDTVGRNRFAGADQHDRRHEDPQQRSARFPARRIIAQPLGQRRHQLGQRSVTPTAFWRARISTKTAAEQEKTNIVTESK